MIWYQKDKPVVPKDANYDYTKVYGNTNNFIGLKELRGVKDGK